MDPNYDTHEEKKMDLADWEKLMNLDEFMNQTRFRNTYVSEPGFLSLYVRKTAFRILNGEQVNDVLDIANIEATHPGQGRFKELIQRIRTKYPKYTIYVECIFNTRLIDYLASMGFDVCQPIQGAPNMFLRAR